MASQSITPVSRIDGGLVAPHEVGSEEEARARPSSSPDTPVSQAPPPTNALNKPSSSAPCAQKSLQRSRSISEFSFFMNSRLTNINHFGLTWLTVIGTSGTVVKTKSTSAKVWQITGSDDALAFHNAKQGLSNKPWYLRPNYTPDQLIVDNDINVKAGTLNALVEKLVDDPWSKKFLSSRPWNCELITHSCGAREQLSQCVLDDLPDICFP
jgi:hypothetical protein